MSAIAIWLLAAAVCFLLELLTGGFAIICLSVGSLFAALAAALGANITWQTVIFCAGTLLGLFTVRPVLRKLLFERSKNRQVRTNADALTRRIGVVSETIDNEARTGLVQIDGDVWRAVAATPSEVIAVGSHVEVVGRESIVLYVVAKD